MIDSQLILPLAVKTDWVLMRGDTTDLPLQWQDPANVDDWNYILTITDRPRGNVLYQLDQSNPVGGVVTTDPVTGDVIFRLAAETVDGFTFTEAYFDVEATRELDNLVKTLVYGSVQILQDATYVSSS